jgi:class 3 adenylate cyclase
MTDIVDSTRLWATHEAEMAVDLEAHDRLLREAIARAGGEVAKHTGDGAIAVFAEPRAAAGAAAAIQRQVASAPWRVPAGLRLRAAVHSGAVYRRDEDVFGAAVNRLARLVELCPPGAVLVSAAKPDPEYRSGEIF